MQKVEQNKIRCFSCLGVSGLVSCLSVANDMHVTEKKEGILRAQMKLLESMEGSVKLLVSNLRTCVNAFLFQIIEVALDRDAKY